MHLAIVPKHTFTFDTVQTTIPIPAGLLETTLADAPAPETPDCLSDLRHYLTMWEETGGDVPPAEGLTLAFADFVEDRAADVVPLVTPLYAASKVRDVFSQWQAFKSDRAGLRLVLADAGCPFTGRLAGIAIGLTREAHHGR
ncbi:MAG: hypothetical protein KL840_18325 [Aquamicrobium sp.]|nr:hypothetical protein [Aquamicrobium sp.]